MNNQISIIVSKLQEIYGASIVTGLRGWGKAKIALINRDGTVSIAWTISQAKNHISKMQK